MHPGFGILPHPGQEISGTENVAVLLEAKFNQENCRATGGRRDEGEYKGMFAGIDSCRMLPHGLEDPDRDL